MTDTVGDWAAWILTGLSAAVALLLLSAVIVSAFRGRGNRGASSGGRG